MRGRITRFAFRLARLGGAGILLCALLAGGLMLAFPFPEELLAPPPESPVVLDREGRPLLVLAAPDGKWRIDATLGEMSPWLPEAVIAVEDAGFSSHLGVDPMAAARAAFQNLAAGRVVSGASTLTMQLARMLDPRPRTLDAKLVEAFRAVELTLLLPRDEILRRWLCRAPCGGNVEGFPAAALVWFGRSAADLSLAEAALLAGLPQSPARLRPDLHPDRAAARRDHVLLRMEEEGFISRTHRDEARRAPVRAAPLRGAGGRLSADAGRHAAFLAVARRPAGGRTTIDLDLQRAVESAAREHATTLPVGCEVAVVVIDVAAAEIRALAGSTDFGEPEGGQVNGAIALRSPGSALKPFLYAAAFEAGRLAPESLLPDRPVARGAWRPRNFDGKFSGAVTAAEALRRSLNVPAILVAEAIGLPRCAGVLAAAGVGLPAGATERGGLAIVTGAVEVRLLDLTNAYATLARGGLFRPARLFPDEPAPERRALSAEAAAAVSTILSCRERAPAGLAGRPESAVPWFSWKTGTSSGRRDAWAVGHNGRFAIGVWAGRFPGHGDYGLTGAGAAEPLLARLFGRPDLASPADPPPPPAIPVRHPLLPEGDAAAVPRIVAPSSGMVFAAPGGTATVLVAAEPAAGLTWFLNGALLPGAAPAPLRLPPGRYELRAVTPAGQNAAVHFTIR
ncbi:MAG: penicillin-binding protein 1C [Planctomycetes bacterium]|nr:penicillin-binding protein 1C [Planctomycetota bacterium]